VPSVGDDTNPKDHDMTDTTAPTTDGWTAPGWEKVRDAFDNNFATGLEVGAAFSAYHRGQKVVDLWGGVADDETGAPWVEDTLMLVFSTTKGATAVCANRLAQEGLLDTEAPVATYWPAFARNGKDEITVAHIMSHQAGLAWVDGQMTAAEALSWEPVIEALENQAPAWKPGTQHGYHATTYGWLVGEVVRRIAGRTVGTFFADEVAGPLGLDFWIGLPEAQEHRVGRLISFIPPGISMETMAAEAVGEPDPVLEMFKSFLGPETPLGKALFAPGFALADADIWNSRAMRAAEVPAANGVTDARSIARMYAACIDEVDGVRLLTPSQVADATRQRTEGPNHVLMDMDIQFGLGFMLHSSAIPLGGPSSFGHFGAGGSLGWADPDADLSFGYVMNRMDIGLAGDPRSYDLVSACYDCAG
jgi:CubicO group peptidase (beta-lactamase class C family)